MNSLYSRSTDSRPTIWLYVNSRQFTAVLSSTCMHEDGALTLNGLTLVSFPVDLALDGDSVPLCFSVSWSLDSAVWQLILYQDGTLRKSR